MKRFWLVGALSLAALACDPNTKSTDAVRNNTTTFRTDENGNKVINQEGWTITSIALRVAVDENDDLLEAGTAGEYGASILSSDLVPNDIPEGDRTVGSEQSLTALDCTSYDVKVTISSTIAGAVTECELTAETGFGPRYLCFSQHRWDISRLEFKNDDLGIDCGFPE